MKNLMRINHFQMWDFSNNFWNYFLLLLRAESFLKKFLISFLYLGSMLRLVIHSVNSESVISFPIMLLLFCGTDCRDLAKYQFLLCSLNALILAWHVQKLCHWDNNPNTYLHFLGILSNLIKRFSLVNNWRWY